MVKAENNAWHSVMAQKCEARLRELTPMVELDRKASIERAAILASMRRHTAAFVELSDLTLDSTTHAWAARQYLTYLLWLDWRQEAADFLLLRHGPCL